MTCMIDDDECLGDVEDVEIGNAVIPLCQFHERTLCELGTRAFQEWYSEELGG
jgi:hypothetical protein